MFNNIIIFTLFFVNYLKSIKGNFVFKCLKDDIKIEKLCAIEGSLTEEDEETLLQRTTNYLYIKDICGKSESCKKMEDSKLYQCFPKIKKLKLGYECSVNEECYSGLCTMNICQGIDFEGDCSDYPNGCKPGMYCAYIESTDTNICYEYAKLNELCGEIGLGYKVECLPGLLCQIRDDNSGTKVCKKWGTFDLNKEVTDERLCKSGMAMYDSEVDDKLKCIAVEEDGECDDETHYCNPQVVGIGVNPDATNELSLECIEGLDKAYVCPLGNAKTKIFENYINEYNKIFDGEELQKSQYFKNGYFNDKKLTELYIKYTQYEYLNAYELIDFEGNLNGLYSCEYDFIWKFLSSNSIKFNIIKILLMILFSQ